MAIRRDADGRWGSVVALGAGIVATVIAVVIWFLSPVTIESDGVLILFGMAFFGGFMFVSGFSEYQRFQLVRGTPTSKVRSMAMGMVEIVGQAVDAGELLASPVTGEDCLFYKYKVEEYQQNGDDKDWVTIDEGVEGTSFYVQDDTGSVLVDPRGADLRVEQDQNVHVDGAESPPPPIQQFIDRNTELDSEDTAMELGPVSLDTGNDRRYTEWFVTPGEQVYVMGEAMDRPSFEGSAQNEENIIVTADEDTSWFTISDSSEKEFIGDLKRNLLLYFVGGGLLMFAGYGILLVIGGWF